MRILYILIFSVITQIPAIAQKKAETVLKLIDEKYPQEKIHLFFNKENYVAGENIWFKAYIFSGYVQSNISTNMYVELYNERKELLDKVQVPLLNAVGEGSLKLNSLTPEGVYYVRAYTKWMMNFDQKFQYLNELLVYNPISTKALTAKAGTWTATAYPESGTLLEEEEQTIAVRLNSNAALPQKWEGYLTEDKDTTKKILSFQSLNAQVASFNFIPAKGKDYILHCVDDQNNRSTTLLRTAASGVVLKAEQKADKIHATMLFKGLPNAGLNYKLVAHMQGQLIYSATIKNTDAMILSGIPVGKLMNGIVHLTLFNESENAVAERLVYIDIDKASKNDVETNSASKRARALNQWEVKVDSALYNYAFSVSDAAITSPRKRSIQSDLWLSDFVNVDNPAWYFSGINQQKKDALDALLISEKWTRFNWKDLLQNSFPEITYKPEKYLTYVGLATRKGIPLYEEDINLLFRYRDSTNQVVQVKTDKEGKFSIINTVFFDTVRVFFQPNKAKVKATDIAVHFEMKNKFLPFSQALPATTYTLVDRKSSDKPPAFVLRENTTMQNQTKINNKYRELDEVKIKSTKKSEKDKLSDKLGSGLFDTHESNSFDFVNEEQGITSYNNIFDWLQGRVAGLTFETQNGEDGSLLASGQKIPVIRGAPVNLVIDELQADLDLVYLLAVSDIALVKVIRGYSMAVAGGGGGGGTIAIYTKKGPKNELTKTSLATGLMYGYRTAPQYNHFDYGEFGKDVITKDNRSQLYWNSNLAPANKNENATINFYNNDVASEYIVTVTGFTQDAKPVFIEKLVKATN